MRIAIGGSSGMIGTALRDVLHAAGHDVVRLVRRPAQAPDEVRWDPGDGELDTAALGSVDAAVNLAGVGIGDRRWTDDHKQAVLSSRVDSTSLLAHALAAQQPRPAALLNASAIGIYGARGDEVLTEDSEPGEGFLPEVCAAWEAATAPAREAGIRTACLRTGLVLDDDDGLLPRTLLPFKLGLGGRLGSGDQYWSWITLDDEVAAIVHLLESDVAGPVNLTAPNPVPFDEVRKALGRILNRPTFWPVPDFALKAVLGPERAEALVLTGQRVLPARLQESGFEFRHTEFETAVRAVLGKA